METMLTKQNGRPKRTCGVRSNLSFSRLLFSPSLQVSHSHSPTCQIMIRAVGYLRQSRSSDLSDVDDSTAPEIEEGKKQGLLKTHMVSARNGARLIISKR